MNKEIVFNCLPPFYNYNPSAAFSILKTFLSDNNFESEIIYWNFLLNKFMEKEIEKSDWIYRPITSLVPYYYRLAIDFNDHKAAGRILTYYKKQTDGSKISPDVLKRRLNISVKQIHEVIDEILGKIDLNRVLLWGISAKSFQWIPGMLLAQEIKKRNNNALIVMGGFSGKDEALEIMKAGRNIDFGIYGEGEYPLLELCRQLKNNEGNLNVIPRLVYRESNTLKISPTATGRFLDYNNYHYPDFSDFLSYSSEEYKPGDIRLPVNSVRSCHWNRCSFCNYNAGYRYRERNPGNIAGEIEYNLKKYKTTGFDFVDNDIIGKDLNRFETLLDTLKASSEKIKAEYSFWAQIVINRELNQAHYKKMSEAGLTLLFAGFEAVSDSLLVKMNKSNRFAHNILYVKFSTKYGIKPNANIIRNVPDETSGDVKESCRNLHFLRFYYHGFKNDFSLFQGTFCLYKGTKYNKVLSDKEKASYSFDPFYYFLPQEMIGNPFNIFGLMKQKLKNEKEWEKFTVTDNYYKSNVFKYRFICKNNKVYYKEYRGRKLINTIIFPDPLYSEVLTCTNNAVVSFSRLQTMLKISYPGVKEKEIIRILKYLKKNGIVYYSGNFEEIVSVVDYTSACLPAMK